MAKYVLLSFEDDNEADEFVRIVNSTQEAGDAIHVRGVFKKPTRFCECGISARSKAGFTRGARWGWVACGKCGRPTQAWAEGNGWYTALGKNLLEVSEVAPEWRGEGKVGHVWDGTAWVPVVSSERLRELQGAIWGRER